MSARSVGPSEALRVLGTHAAAMCDELRREPCGDYAATVADEAHGDFCEALRLDGYAHITASIFCRGNVSLTVRFLP